MTPRIEHLDLEDDYPDYVDETWGYAWDVWDTTSARVISRHDEIVADGTEDDPAGLTNLERWALIKHQQASGDSILEVLRLILAQPDDRAGLNMAEIFEFAVRAFAAEELFDEASHTEKKLEELWPEYPGIRLARVTRETLEGRPADEILGELLEAWKDDADQLIELGREWLYLGRTAEARETLIAAREAAERLDDRPSLLDVELMLRELE